MSFPDSLFESSDIGRDSEDGFRMVENSEMIHSLFLTTQTFCSILLIHTSWMNYREN